jgi:predicted component of viral defense system (DUF524 family)
MNYKEIEEKLNQYNDWNITSISDDGRVNSQDSESFICEKINNILGITKTKTSNREKYDLYMKGGQDLKIVEPNSFTNTISFTKLAKMLNLKGNSNNTIFDSYQTKKMNGELKLVEDYVIVFLNKQTKKITIASLTELPEESITVNPSNCIQTKIPTNRVERTYDEKFNLVHNLFIEYINKRILTPAKNWEKLING